MYNEFFDDLKNLQDERPAVCDKIKSHNLPVIIFGAGTMAQWVTEHLNTYGVKIDGYAVDAQYFKPNQTYLNLPVYNFAELRAQPEKYVFVLGINDEGTVNRRIYKFLQDKDIIYYAVYSHQKYFPFKREYLLDNRDKFFESFSLLEDELSRKTFIAFFKAKLTDNPNYNVPVMRPDDYFNELTVSAKHVHWGGAYVDCGAYRGDTIKRFVEWSGGRYGKIFGFEADPANFAELKNFVQQQGYKNVTLFNCGVWHEKAQIPFDAQGNTLSGFSEKNSNCVAVDKLDNLLANETVTLIKMMIEGSEFNALQGANAIITEQKPCLAVSVQHLEDDLIKIPQFIKSLNNGYKFYLRKHSLIPPFGMILYAIP